MPGKVKEYFIVLEILYVDRHKHFPLCNDSTTKVQMINKNP